MAPELLSLWCALKKTEETSIMHSKALKGNKIKLKFLSDKFQRSETYSFARWSLLSRFPTGTFEAL